MLPLKPLAIAGLALLAAVHLAAPAAAFDEYTVHAHGVASQGKTPPQNLQGDITSSYNSTLSWRATADRGIYRSRSRVENDFVCHCTPQIFPGPDRAFSLLGLMTVSGPPGQAANGTVHLTLEGKLEQAGQYPWNSSVELQLYPGLNEYYGRIDLDGSGGMTSSGVLAGQSGGTVDKTLDLPFSISESGDWTFLIILETGAAGTGYGSGYNMGSSNFWDDINGDGYGGLHFAADGPAFTLPAGFVVNSEHLGIVNNYWVGGTVGVAAAPAERASLSLVLGSNPVRAGTRVSYMLPQAGSVRVEALDLQGRVVAVLDEGWREAGAHQASWAASRSVPTGLYFVRLALEGEQVVRKVTVLE
jgi:hypothetical protein